MDPEPVKRASEWDKAYIRRLGEYKRESREAIHREWMALPLSERLRIIAERTVPLRDDREPEEPEKIYERARRLGLYKE